MEFDTKPTGVEVEANHGGVHESVPQEQVEMHQGDEIDGLGHQVPTPQQTAEPLSLRRLGFLTKKWKQSHIPNYKGTKYNVALTQVTKSLQGSKNATSLAQMSIKLMSKGVHHKADTIGAIMAQLSMKAAIKKWGGDAELAITNEMKQLHWRNSYQPKHWNELSKTQKDQILKSHIFVE